MNNHSTNAIQGSSPAHASGQRLGLKRFFFHRDGSLPPVAFILTFMAFCILCGLFPYSGDDWAWGSSIGLERLGSWFNDYNGRYVGNLVVTVLTRSIILRTVVMAAVLTGIATCIYLIVGKKNTSAFWISLILIAMLPSNVKAQGIVWTSGFANYAIPTLLVLLYILCFKGVFSQDYKQYRTQFIPALLILGFVSSLIVENITVSNIVMGVILLIYTRKRHGAWDAVQIAFIVGAILGALLMFSNSGYHRVAEGGDAFRSFSLDGLVPNALDAWFSSISYMFCLNNQFLVVVLCLLTLLFAKSFTMESKANKQVGWFLWYLAPLALLVVTGLSIFTFYRGYWNMGHFATLINGVASFIFMIVLLVIAVVYAQKRRNPTLLFISLFAGSQLVPLLVVTPVGPRNFLPIYMLLCLYALVLWKDLIPQPQQNLNTIFALATVIAFIPWLVIYGEVNGAATERLEAVETALSEGSPTITVKKLPYGSHVWTGDPSSEPWNTRFKLFYSIPEDVELICK